MNDYEISRLKRQIQRKNDQLKEEREEKDQIQKELIQTRADRDKYYNQLVIARRTIQSIDITIAQNVKEIKLKLQGENSQALQQLNKYKEEVNQVKRVNQKYIEEVKNKEVVISQLGTRLKEMARKHKDPSLLVNTKEISDYVTVNHNQLNKITEKYNKVCQDMDNILAQNKILRKLHGVPDNFGFDLEEIKVAEKQQLQDYKTQCRKLQTEIQELEAERTQLRYRLRQYNTLYSNKGQRYKDLTNKQLDLLDTYALSLKQGRHQLPQIDKSHREMEKEILKLRTQVETLQMKGHSIMPRSPANQIESEKMSNDGIRRLQEQIRSTLQPFVQDIRKLNQNNLNSIIHSLQSVQGQSSIGVSVVNEAMRPMGNNFRPPIPLPASHNDWSKIKEGYSYAFTSKIPIEMKDLDSDMGFDVISAKYEVAALQLQNIESMKLLKEKNKIQTQLGKELQELKKKFKKCVMVQDDLFMRYFKEKELVRDKMKELQIDRNNVLSDRDQLKTKYQILNDAFTNLSKGKDVEKKLSDFTSRLAIAEAEVVKLSRKYDTIHEEQKTLRQAYTKLQSKSLEAEYTLKEKLLITKKNEKQLTVLLNQILLETKDSVSPDIHYALLGRNQCMNDKFANFASREAELRLKINRLESIQRQMNIKDQIIQNLRQDSLDLSLELQILRNRLQMAESGYRGYRQTFRRLVSYVNDNNISLMNYFKKFDRDGSGALNKDQLQTALSTLGFKLGGGQMQILFSEFDLDGSGKITYREFIRKLKRGGALARSKQQQALFLLFKAIKQSNLTIKKAFQIIDMDGSNQISKTEFESALRKIGIEVSSNTVQFIFKLGDGDMDGKMTCGQLQKIFADVVKDSAIQQKEISNDQLDWKYLVVLKIQECSNKFKLSLKDTFTSLDKDGNACLTIAQLSQFFTKSSIQLPKKDLLELFDFLDRHKDGKIEYSQFLKILAEAKKEKNRVQRIQYIKKRAEQIRKDNQVNNKEGEKQKISQEAGTKVRLMALETKQENLIKKNEKIIKSLVTKQQQIYDLQKNIEQNEKQISRIQSEYYREKESNIILQQKMKNYIGEDKAKQIQGEISHLKIQTLQLKTSLQTYKGLYQSIADKNKGEQLRIGKLEAELNKYYDIVKDFQSHSDLNSRLGQLAIEIEHSKRNEQLINRKYDSVINDMRKNTDQNVALRQETVQKEMQFVNLHIFTKQKFNLQQRIIDELSSKVFPTVSLGRIQEFLVKLRDISNSKSQLEIQNQALRDKNFSLQLRNDYVQNERVLLDELERKLRRTYTDESSVAIIELTKKLSEYKMSDLKSKRECSLLKQKEEYFMRVNNANNQNIKDLQKQLASWEVKYNQRQQFWRKRIADQLKLMEDLQKQTTKAKQQEKKAVIFFQQRQTEANQIDKNFDNMGQDRKARLSTIIMNPTNNRNQQEAISSRMELQQLRTELLEKQKEIVKLRAALQDLMPESQIRFTDFAGQMGQSTNSFVMQTDLTTSQLKNNARRFINNQKQHESFYKQEVQRLTQAAQQSIDTLQKIIDDKNQQLRRKDKIIDDLRRDFMKNKEDDCVEIQRLNLQIRELRQKKQVSSINEIMNKSTKGNFFNSKADDKVNGLIKIIQGKDEQIHNLKDQIDKLYLSKNKGSSVEAARKIQEKKLKQLQQDREADHKKYMQNQMKLNQRIKKLQKESIAKDQKYVNLQNALKKIKDDIVNEKNNISQPNFQDIEAQILSMNKGANLNDSKMEIMLKKAMETIQQMNKKNRQNQVQIKRLKQETKMNRTMQRR